LVQYIDMLVTDLLLKLDDRL